MKKVLKIVGLLVGVLLLGAGVFVGTAKPKARETSDLEVDKSPEAVARGEYLVEHVVACIACHSDVDVMKFAMPYKGHKGAGLPTCFPEEMKMPGKICPPNITQDKETGIGEYTDDEILRAFREGVKRDGSAIFPIMPYQDYRNLSDPDAHAIVAYLRTFAPIKQEIPKTSVDFPVSFFITMEPQPLTEPVPHPDENDELALGKYLTDVAGCKECHMQWDEQMQPIPGTEFGGGRVFGFPWGTVITPNITAHETGRLPTTREAFIGLFRSFQDREAIQVEVTNGQGTVMPWPEFSEMTEKDLGAIWAYLQTVKPIDNEVNKWPDAN